MSMSTIIKTFLAVALAMAVFSSAADARGGHGGHGGHGGGWHGGGWHGGGHYGGGWHGGHYGGGRWYGGWGGAYLGPYPYYAPSYYYPGDCGWVRVRVWRNGYWVVRRAWRCW
jgi:hypothetical protein